MGFETHVTECRSPSLKDILQRVLARLDSHRGALVVASYLAVSLAVVALESQVDAAAVITQVGDGYPIEPCGKQRLVYAKRRLSRTRV